MKDQLYLLKQSLKNLSKSYQEQLEVFPKYVDVFDEVISDFDNAFRLLPMLMEENLVSYGAIKEILKCYNLIDLNLAIEERCTDENFEKASYWQLVREYANNALETLEEYNRNKF